MKYEYCKIRLDINMCLECMFGMIFLKLCFIDNFVFNFEVLQKIKIYMSIYV